MTYYVINQVNSINNTTDNLPLAALMLGASDKLLVQYDGSILATGLNSDAVYLNGNDTNGVITVNGLISATRNGIYSLGQYARITVNGQVYGDSTGISIANSGTVYVSATGLVSGGTEGIALNGATLINNGTVNGSGNDAIQLSSGNITNSGLISSNYTAIFFGADGTGYINNIGTIVGGLDTYFAASDPTHYMTIDNSGLWSGSLGLTPGSDTITNTGRMTGGISLGAGDDLLDSRNGFIGGDIDGGTGADTIRAGAEDNVISGGAGGDTLNGGGGINTISYSSSADRVRVDLLNGIASGGDAAGDTLYHFQNINGSLNADKLTGDNGDNVISGVLGNDVLVGYGGNDTFSLIGGASLAGGPGLAAINGGAGNDVFQLFSLAPATYGDAFTAGTRVIGGSGYDTLELRNTSPVTFVSTTVSGVERIVVEDGFNYTLTSHNTTVAAGESLEVDASGLTGSKHLYFTGSAETDGTFQMFGGAGKDLLAGGAGADLLSGGKGMDSLTGGGGADIFDYNSYADSTFSSRDTITDLVAASDKFQLNVAVTKIDGSVSGSVSSQADLSALLSGHLLAHHAIVAQVTGGSLSGQTLLAIDSNGTAGLQSSDYVMNVSGMTGTLTTSNFVVG